MRKKKGRKEKKVTERKRSGKKVPARKPGRSRTKQGGVQKPSGVPMPPDPL